ncbi:MAG: NAD(+)/NADH kinase [Fimbriimonadaceae bacterium]|nr:NAD(+)/NADH kinase [Fimbriimonadaceae bacterium]
MRIHFLVNRRREDAVQAAKTASKWLADRGVLVAADDESFQSIGVQTVSQADFADCDLVVTFGGDGTLIRAAHLCSEKGTPILGVYYGRFGFVTQCTSEELGACLSGFFDGKAHIERRMMLQIDLMRGNKSVATIHALNEMALQREVMVRMMTFEVFVNDLRLTSYPADGVMIATPTGSTAYNLSAGGPICDPQVEALVLNALAPHTLSARPLVLHPNSEIFLRVSTEGDAVLSADGQVRLHILSGDAVKVTRSKRVTNLMTVEKDDFLHKLSNRLFWSQSILGELS